METFLYLCTRFGIGVESMKEQKPKFMVLYSEEADAFLDAQTDKVRAKILYNILKASYSTDPKLFKKLENTDIWEFRTLFNKRKYRVLAFWDKTKPVNTLVIATHGFVKKTQKTPQKEINKAITIREIYFKNKLNEK